MQSRFRSKLIHFIVDMLHLRHCLWRQPVRWHLVIPASERLCLSEISSPWVRAATYSFIYLGATFSDSLLMNRIWQTWWKLVSKITLQKHWGSHLACSLAIPFRSLVQKKPATMSWGNPAVRNGGLPARWCGSYWANVLPGDEPSDETAAMANRWTAVLSLSNIPLCFSHKRISDYFRIHLFICGCCFSCRLPHQKLHNLVGLVQCHLEEWLVHSQLAK